MGIEPTSEPCEVLRILIPSPNSLKWTSGCAGRRIKSIEMDWRSSSMQTSRDVQFNLCIRLFHGALPPGFPGAPFLAPLICLQTGLFGSDSFMRDDAEPRRQSLLPALLFSLFGFKIDVVRIFELPVPLATKLAEVSPIVLFAVAHVFHHFKVRLGAQVFHFNLKRPQEITAKPGAFLQLLENLDSLLEFLVEQEQIFVDVQLRGT